MSAGLASGAGWEHRVESPEEMVGFGRRMGERLRGGEVVALSGGLGAGKTHFTKGLAAGVGYGGRVTSPTFSLVHEYAGGRVPVFHFDFYRMEDEEEVLRIGWDEYLDEGGVVVVEWPDRFPGLLPADAVWLEFVHADGGRLVRGRA